MKEREIPAKAAQSLNVITELLGSTVVGAYLYGSAITGGLRRDSDIDVLVIVKQSLSAATRRSLADKLMLISGKVGNADEERPLEVTVVNIVDIVPWKYPPKKEFIYGEWLRDKYKKGPIPEPEHDPDLAIVLCQVRNNSLTLVGRDASEVLDLIPKSDIRKALKDCLPDLFNNLKGDERNVILTFARIWVTAATGKFVSKDAAADWAVPRLPKEQAALLDMAGKAYRGERIDIWEALDQEVALLAGHMKDEIYKYLDDNNENTD